MSTPSLSIDSLASSTPFIKENVCIVWPFLCFRHGHLLFPEGLRGSACGRCILDCLYIGSSLQFRTKLLAKCMQITHATVKTSWLEHVHRDVFCSVFPNLTASFSLLEIVLLLLCFSFVPISWAPRNFIIKAFIALGPSEGALPRLLVEPNEMKGKPEDPAAQTPCDVHTAIAPDHPWPRGHHVPAEPERARPTMRDEPGTPQNDLNSYWL